MKQRLLSILLSVAVLLSLFSGMLVMPAAAQTVSVGGGDYNGDGVANATDMMAVLNYIRGEASMSSTQKAQMDVFADGTVDIFDAACMMAYIGGSSKTLGGAVSGMAQEYAQFQLETVTYEETIRAGEIVEIALTSSAVTDLVGLELHIDYDDVMLEFVEATGTSVTANASPLSAPSGEVWLTMLPSKEFAYSEGDTVTTLRFKALVDIAMDTDVTFSMVKAASAQAIAGYYPLVSTGVNGGITVEQTTSTTTPSQTYVTYTIETVAHEGTIAAGETVEWSIRMSEVADINGVQIYLCYDDTKWEWQTGAFQGVVSGFSFKNINPSPAAPITDQGEVWFSAMDPKPYAVEDGAVFATFTLKALCDIAEDEAITACYSLASSHHGTMNGYEPVSTWTNGGVTIEKSGYTGLYGDYFYKNDKKLTAYQLVKHDGEYYFVGDGDKIVKNKTVYLYNSFIGGLTYPDGTPMTAGNYEFDAEGKMVIKNGIIGNYLYKNNVMLTAYQLAEHDGYFYFISDGNQFVRGKTVYLYNSFIGGQTYPDGTPMTAGNYTFNVYGEMVIRNGVYGDSFYKNNVKLTAYQLVKHNGDYYFIGDGDKVVKNKTVYLYNSFIGGLTYPDGTPMTAGNYEFDANGKMVIKNGIVGNYLYKNNVMYTAYQLVKYNGSYYFISDGNQFVRGKTVYLYNSFIGGQTYPDGAPMTAGNYTFNVYGEMVIKDGVYGDSFYKNNVKLTAYQLVKHNGDYYFVGDGNKIAKNKTVYLYKSFIGGLTYPDGTPMTAGNYEFDADGKMVIKNGLISDSFYKNNVMFTAYRLIEHDGDYYFIGDGNKIVKNKTVYLYKSFIGGLTYTDGTPITAGNYEFDADGKMIIKNGVVGNYFYRNNTMLMAYQLVKYEGGFYFIGDGNQITRNKTVYVSSYYLEGMYTDEGYPLFEGYYTFDENGKMIL